MAARDGVPDERIFAVIGELHDHGLIAGDGGAALTPRGEACAGLAIAARRELLGEALADGHAHRDPAVEELLQRLARELAGEPPLVKP